MASNAVQTLERPRAVIFPRVAAPLPVELAVIVPSCNERDNVAPLLARLASALAGIEWEVIYVDDDSPDGTAEAVRAIAMHDPRVRCLRRVGRRGLSTAVIEGMLATSAPYLAVIDADMQHDEKLLPPMLETLQAGKLDIVVGSRYVTGASLGDWDKRRVAISSLATRLARLVVPAELSDPMSGFFMVSRPAFEGAVRHLSGQGFKILLDLFASTPVPYRFAELPYVFGRRQYGESKLNSLVAWEYMMLLLDKLIGRFVPVRFVFFAAIGLSGVVVHFAVLYLALQFCSFPVGQALATFAATTSNFVLNNLLTYRDKRLTGRQFITGLLTFYAICGVGAVANIGVASAAFARNYSWWASGLAGAAIGVVWNYAVSSVFTWSRR